MDVRQRLPARPTTQQRKHRSQAVIWAWQRMLRCPVLAAIGELELARSERHMQDPKNCLSWSAF